MIFEVFSRRPLHCQTYLLHHLFGTIRLVFLARSAHHQPRHPFQQVDTHHRHCLAVTSVQVMQQHRHPESPSMGAIKLEAIRDRLRDVLLEANLGRLM